MRQGVDLRNINPGRPVMQVVSGEHQISVPAWTGRRPATGVACGDYNRLATRHGRSPIDRGGTSGTHNDPGISPACPAGTSDDQPRPRGPGLQQHDLVSNICICRALRRAGEVVHQGPLKWRSINHGRPQHDTQEHRIEHRRRPGQVAPKITDRIEGECANAD